MCRTRGERCRCAEEESAARLCFALASSRDCISSTEDLISGCVVVVEVARALGEWDESQLGDPSCFEFVFWVGELLGRERSD